MSKVILSVLAVLLLTQDSRAAITPTVLTVRTYRSIYQ